MKEKRVVITGIGVISPNGIGGRVFWEALKEGRSGIKEITFFDATDFPTRIAGEIHDFVPEDFMDRKKARRMARFSQFAVACARMALDDAGLDRVTLERHPPKIVLGISSAGIGEVEEQSAEFLTRKNKRVNPMFPSMVVPNAAAGEVATILGLSGRNLTISTACTSSLDAVGAAYNCIKYGEEKIAIAGGTDAPVTPLMLASLCAAEIVSRNNERPSEASKPFDRLRDGGVLSEGAGIILLEELAFARARGAGIYGEIVGYGQSIEGKEEPSGSGLKRAILAALTESGLPSGELDYVSAHAPSDQLLDACETRILKEVFGARAYVMPVSSIKGHIGNPYSAGGVLQVVSVLFAMKENMIPPTINYSNADPECDLYYVPNVPRFNTVNTALINSHGFGGANSALIIKRI